MSLLRAIGDVGRRHGAVTIGARQTIGSRSVVPPPVKGLNSRDPYAAMDPQFAIVLDNYFPDHGAVRLRKGSRQFAALGGTTSAVESLIPHYSGDSGKLFAAAQGSLFEVVDLETVDDPVADRTIETAAKAGLTGNRWSHANIGGHTVMVSGEDPPQRIEPNGAFAAAHGWTGLDAGPLSELKSVTAFKNRLFFTRAQSPVVTYGPLNGVQGALAAFDLSFVAPEGGNALRIGTMTIDSGSGVDDLFLVFMEHGVVLLYRGIDPSASDENGFFIVGTFKIGALVGDRPLVNVGGDLLVLTVDGVVSMAQTLKRGRSGQKGLSVSEAITPTLRNRAALFGSTDGWDAVLHPPASWLVFNVPQPGGEQFVMNTQTGAWCRFRGWNVRCLGRFRDDLYFGGPDGKVYRADTGHDDDDATINGDIQTAYNYFRSPQEKRFTMLRSLVESDGDISFRLGSTADFGDAGELTTPVSLTNDAPEWGAAVWNVSPWLPGRVHYREWQATNRTGTALSVRMASRSKGANIALFASDVVYERATGIA